MKEQQDMDFTSLSEDDFSAILKNLDTEGRFPDSYALTEKDFFEIVGRIRSSLENGNQELPKEQKASPNFLRQQNDEISGSVKSISETLIDFPSVLNRLTPTSLNKGLAEIFSNLKFQNFSEEIKIQYSIFNGKVIIIAPVCNESNDPITFVASGGISKGSIYATVKRLIHEKKELSELPLEIFIPQAYDAIGHYSTVRVEIDKNFERATLTRIESMKYPTLKTIFNIFYTQFHDRHDQNTLNSFLVNGGQAQISPTIFTDCQEDSHNCGRHTIATILGFSMKILELSRENQIVIGEVFSANDEQYVELRDLLGSSIKSLTGQEVSPSDTRQIPVLTSQKFWASMVCNTRGDSQKEATEVERQF